MIFTSPLLRPTRRRPAISPRFTSRSCSTMTVSVAGENRSMGWNVEIGCPVSRLSTTRNCSSSTGWNSECAVYTTCWLPSDEAISYCHTAYPRSVPRNMKTNESRVAGMAVRSKRRALGGAEAGVCPKARTPGAGAETAPRLTSSGKQRQGIGLEDCLLVRVAERQREELVDVLLHVLHTRAGPVGSPQHAVADLRETRKVLQQTGGRYPGDVEPDVPVTAQDEKRLRHVERAAAVRHHDAQRGEVDRHVVELHRVAVS